MRAAIFIDGGYLLKQLHEAKITPDYTKIAQYLLQPLRRQVSLDLLRCYFYYCPPWMSPNPTDEERRRMAAHERFVAELEDIDRWQVRLGKLERRREGDKEIFAQKRVDVQLSVDLVRHAAAGHIQHAVLLAGDSDFIPAVVAAKESGATLTLWCGRDRSPHRELMLAADEVQMLDWKSFPRRRPDVRAPTPVSAVAAVSAVSSASAVAATSSAGAGSRGAAGHGSSAGRDGASGGLELLAGGADAQEADEGASADAAGAAGGEQPKKKRRGRRGGRGRRGRGRENAAGEGGLDANGAPLEREASGDGASDRDGDAGSEQGERTAAVVPLRAEQDGEQNREGRPARAVDRDLAAQRAAQAIMREGNIHEMRGSDRGANAEHRPFAGDDAPRESSNPRGGEGRGRPDGRSGPSAERENDAPHERSSPRSSEGRGRPDGRSGPSAERENDAPHERSSPRSSEGRGRPDGRSGPSAERENDAPHERSSPRSSEGRGRPDGRSGPSAAREPGDNRDAGERLEGREQQGPRGRNAADSDKTARDESTAREAQNPNGAEGKKPGRGRGRGRGNGNKKPVDAEASAANAPRESVRARDLAPAAQLASRGVREQAVESAPVRGRGRTKPADAAQTVHKAQTARTPEPVAEASPKPARRGAGLSAEPSVGEDIVKKKKTRRGGRGRKKKVGAGT